MRAIVLALVAALAASSSSAQSIDDLIALKRTSGTPAISACPFTIGPNVTPYRCVSSARSTDW